MKRYEILDGMRGYFLVFMMLNHLIFAGGYLLVKINHNQLAFVEDAQGFVFLSGLLVGTVYARKMLKQGYEAGRNAIHRRAFLLYRYSMALVLAVLVAKALLPDAHHVWYNWVGDTHFDDPLRLAAIATFLFQPTFMDILPQYAIYMIFAPALVKLVLEGRWPDVVAGSLVVWVAAQLGLNQIVSVPLDEAIRGADQQGMRASFNPMGWQIVFYSGLVLGALTSSGRIDWSRILSPENSFIPKLALIVTLFFVPLRLMTANGLMPEQLIGKFATMEIRADFGPVYLINFAALGLLVAWLVMAGPRHPAIWVQRVAAAVTWVFSLKFLQLLGRHSLHVYMWHVVIVYLVYYFDGRTPELDELTKTAIAVIAVALLALPALWRERDRLFGPPGAETETAKLR